MQITAEPRLAGSTFVCIIFPSGVDISASHWTRGSEAHTIGALVRAESGIRDSLSSDIALAPRSQVRRVQPVRRGQTRYRLLPGVSARTLAPGNGLGDPPEPRHGCAIRASREPFERSIRGIRSGFLCVPMRRPADYYIRSTPTAAPRPFSSTHFEWGFAQGAGYERGVEAAENRAIDCFKFGISVIESPSLLRVPASSTSALCSFLIPSCLHDSPRRVSSSFIILDPSLFLLSPALPRLFHCRV